MFITLLILILLLVYRKYVFMAMVAIVVCPFVFPMILYRHYRSPASSFFFRFMVWVALFIAFSLASILIGLALTKEGLH